MKHRDRNGVRISKRTGYALLLVSLMSSFIVRYPLFKVNSGTFDNEFIFYLSKVIALKGYAPWIANTSSYFGLHRFSYPQGAPFLFSIFQQISGHSGQDMIYIYSSIESVIALLFAFMFALILRKRDYIFAFFVSFIFTTAPAYVYASSWTLSARSLFVTFFVFFMYIAFSDIIKKKRFFILILIFVIIFSVHRMAFFLIISLIPTYFIFLIYRKFKKKSIRYDKKKIYFLYILISLFILLFLLFGIYLFYGQLSLKNPLRAYQSGNLINGSNIFAILANVGISLTVSGGILTALGILSIFYIFKKKDTHPMLIFVMLFFVFSFSVFLYKNYFRIYFSFIISIFISIYLIIFIYNKKFIIKKTYIISILLILSLIFSIFMQSYWNGTLKGGEGDFMNYDQERSVITSKYLKKTNIFTTTWIERYLIAHTDKIAMPFVKEEDPYYEGTSIDKISPEDLNLSLNLKIYSGRFYLYFPETSPKELYKVFSNSSNYNYYMFKYSDNGTFVNAVKNLCYSIYSNRMSGWSINIYYFDAANPNIANKKLYVHG